MRCGGKSVSHFAAEETQLLHAAMLQFKENTLEKHEDFAQMVHYLSQVLDRNH